MPPKGCVVSGCNNTFSNVKDKGTDVQFYRFPNNNILQQEWVNQCKIAGTWNPGSSRICSIHFREKDYQRDLKNEFLGLPLRKKLKRTAVPSINIPVSGNETSNLVKVEDQQESGGEDKVKNYVRTKSIHELLNLPEIVEVDYESKYNNIVVEFTEFKKKYKNIHITYKQKMETLMHNVNYYREIYQEITQVN